MQYLFKRGEGSTKRVMHIERTTSTGEHSMQPLCGNYRVTYDTTCNLPLGRPTCKECLRALYRRQQIERYYGVR